MMLNRIIRVPVATNTTIASSIASISSMQRRIMIRSITKASSSLPLPLSTPPLSIVAPTKSYYEYSYKLGHGNHNSNVYSNMTQTNFFSTSSSSSTNNNNNNQNTTNNNNNDNTIRLSKLISNQGINIQMSRKSAESIITNGQVTIAGRIVTNPSLKIDIYDTDVSNTIKVAGRHFILNVNRNQNQAQAQAQAGTANTASTSTIASTTAQPQIQMQSQFRTRVWIAHKLKGEIVAEHDPHGRPSLIERLYRGGVGKPKKKKKNNTNANNSNRTESSRIHLKPVGRLDMMTEGLILITNDGQYVRELTLPSNNIQRTYRVRVHGHITMQKLNVIRNGLFIDNTYYKGMDINLELANSKSKKSRKYSGGGGGNGRSKGGNTNTWVRITCTEGKNRMIRKVLDHMGLQVTRLIRISFGDYDLNTIPPGLAIEVPVKSLDSQKRRGKLISQKNKKKRSGANNGSRNNNGGGNGNGNKGSMSAQEEVATPVQWIRHV